MTFRTRVTILIILLLAFLTAVPLVLFFAFGLSYDWEEHDIFKTGAIVISSVPRGATVTINGGMNKHTTPVKIKHLLPGEYDIRVSRAGYQDWTEFVHLSPEQVFEIPSRGRPLYLFLASTESTFTASTVEEFITDEFRAYLRIASTTLTYINLNKDQATSIPLAFTESINSRLIGSRDWIVVTYGSAQYLVNPDTGQFTNVNHLQPDPASFGSVSDDETLYLNKSNQLSLLNLNSGRVDSFYTSVSAYDLGDNGKDVFMIQGNAVIQKDLASTTRVSLYEKLPKYSYSLITAADNRTFVQLDSILYELKDGLLTVLGKDVQNTFWDQPSKTLFAYNLNNVWSLTKDSRELLPLVSSSDQTLSNLVSSELLGKLFYIEAGQVKAIDTSEGRHKITVLPLIHEVQAFELDEKGENITYWSVDKTVYTAKIR